MNLPRLRFKEFSGAWDVKKLGEIADKIGDGLHSTPAYDENGDYHFINGNNLINSKVSFSGNTKRVGENEFNKYKVDINNQTILMSINGTIGNMAFYNGEKVILGKSACYLNLKLNENKYFLFNVLQTSKITENFKKELTGSTIKNLSLTTIKNTKIYLPSLSEQTKIANFLTVVDEKITQITQKTDLLARYKKGVMQQLFSQQLRFKDDNGQDFPDWGEKSLGDVYNITSSKRVFQHEWTKSGVPFYRAREVVKLSEKGFVENELFISNQMYSEYKSKYGVPKKDDLLVTGVGTIGKLYVVKDSDQFYFKDGNIIWLKTLNIANSQFVKQLFQSSIVKKQIEDNASITTVGTYTIDSAKKTSIPFPTIKEQTKIANFLTSIDDKISHNQTQLNALKQYKQGLLQQLFV